MTVSVILARKGHDVVTATAKSSMADICRLMEKHGIGAVVIVGEGGRVAGIVSERDAVRAIVQGGAAAFERPVSAYMTTKVVTCAPQDTLAGLMQVMTDNKFRHLPVVERGRLIGIVSIGDVVKSRIAEAEAESQAMREYITTG